MVDTFTQRRLDRCISLLRRGHDKTAVHYLTGILDVDPDHTDALRLLATAQRHMRHLDKASDTIRHALRGSPNDTDVIHEGALIEHALGHTDAAMALLDRAVNLEPENPYHYACRGFMAGRAGHYEKAESDLRKALALDPSNRITENNLQLLLDSKPVGDTPKTGQFAEPKAEPKLTAKHYLTTLARVFTKRSSLIDFLRFLRKRRQHS